MIHLYNVIKMSVRNCLKCKHYFNRVVYEYHKEKKYIVNMYRESGCDKLKILFNQRNSEEKDNESKFVNSKCYQGKYFDETEKFTYSDIVMKEV